jgi:hypothetical protein
LNYLNPELARTLTRNQVKKMIRKIGQEWFKYHQAGGKNSKIPSVRNE